MKHVIIGTAGHVDHGKTSLIQALTGTNTDRLKEEQERGMSIDIGFASLKLPNGDVVGIVDVPGHERFLKNMLAGATGVDVVLLVVAADEGVMPQTVEHLEILRLLDVKAGVVALTKCDMVDNEWLETVEEDTRAHLKGTPLEASPLLKVSSTTGRGIEALKKALLSAVSRVSPRNSSLPARLPIDRVFVRPGFGAVVTGTLAAGTLHVGDSVELVPQGLQTRIRGLQVHNVKVQTAEAGSRVAVNLAGIEAAEIERGAQLAAPGAVGPTNRIDAQFTMAASDATSLKHNARIRLHIGTAEVIGRASILDRRSQLMSSEDSFIQIKGETEFAAVRGDRFVLRSYSPMVTLGGGQILATNVVGHKKGDLRVIELLEATMRGTPLDLLRTALAASDYGLTLTDAVNALAIGKPELSAAAEELLQSGEAVALDKERIVAAVKYGTLLDRVESALAKYHAQFPLRGGMQREELRQSIGKGADARVFGSFMAHWEAAGKVRSEAALVRLCEFTVQLNERQLGLLERIEEYYVERGIDVPAIPQVSSMVRAPADAVAALLKVGVERGRFHYASDGVYYAAATIESLKTMLTQFMQTHPSITVGEFRDLTGSNRKLSLQALEYLDTIKFTVRSGDNRTLGG